MMKKYVRECNERIGENFSTEERYQRETEKRTRTEKNKAQRE